MSNRIQELDGIRGIAILMVVVHHYITHQIPHLGKDLAEGSLIYWCHLPATAFWSGVDLFFVLSGFLIGGIILDNHANGNFLKVFWIRRCCRILPVLFLLIGSAWLLKSCLDGERYAWLYDNLLPWWSYLTFSQNIVMSLQQTYGGHALAMTWSLAVEEQFYIVAPLLMLLFGKRIWTRGLLPLAVLALVLRLAFPGFHTDVTTLFRMDAIVAGVLVAVLLRNETAWGVLKDVKGSIAIGFLLLVVATGGMIIRGFGQVKFSWFVVLYAAFLLTALLYRGSRWTWILRSAPLCFYGSIAYGLYMYHQSISGMLHGWLRDGAAPSLVSPTSAAITGTAFLVSTGVAWVSFRMYESYFLKIGRQWKYGAKRAPAPTMTAVADA